MNLVIWIPVYNVVGKGSVCNCQNVVTELILELICKLENLLISVVTNAAKTHFHTKMVFLEVNSMATMRIPVCNEVSYLAILELQRL